MSISLGLISDNNIEGVHPHWLQRENVRDIIKSNSILKLISLPLLWVCVHWRFLSLVTHAAGQPAETPVLSTGWRCRRGKWRCRAVHNKRRKDRWCKIKPKARGWVPASRCSRLCRKVRDCNVPTLPRALQRTQMHSTTLPPPGDGHVMRRTCYLIR